MASGFMGLGSGAILGPGLSFAIHLAPARALGLARHKNVRRDIPVSMLLQDDSVFWLRWSGVRFLENRPSVAL